MKIGIDIDGVILNSENLIRTKAELYDLLELHKDGVVNKNGFLDSERYDWNTEQLEKFRECFIDVTKDSVLMPGAKEVLQLLKNDGHELIIITARGITAKGMKKATEEKFKQYNLEFDQYYWRAENKTEICKNENIDVMIDDRASICKDENIIF